MEQEVCLTPKKVDSCDEAEAEAEVEAEVEEAQAEDQDEDEAWKTK